MKAGRYPPIRAVRHGSLTRFIQLVFVSLQLSGGIVGDYPINYDELTLAEKNERYAIINVNSGKTDIGTVYLERLIRQDDTGIWTVIGYDYK